MKINFEFDGNLSEAIRTLGNEQIPKSRREMVNALTQQTLETTRRETPIDTGRSRAAWSSALTQAGQNGSASGAASEEGHAVQSETATISATSSTNRVPYIAYLEYGTSKMAPFAMVRKSLAKVISQISHLFRIHN